jgi:antirestriction protein ArdC
MSNQEVYEAITARMIKALKSGTVPWRKPWSAAAGGRPRSMSTREPYKGINTLILGLTAQEKGHTSPW